MLCACRLQKMSASETASPVLERDELYQADEVQLEMDDNGDAVLLEMEVDPEEKRADALSMPGSPEVKRHPDSSDQTKEAEVDTTSAELGETSAGQAEPTVTPPLVKKAGEAEPVSGPRECPTCYVALENGLEGVPGGCAHRFCVECIQGWLRNSNTCPICRNRFSSLHIYNGEELMNTVAVPTVQVRMAPPLRSRPRD